CLQGDTAPLTF
nr:immunoglobulin light chain junction region [Macaca mulatta]MOV83852.1 immunoglobulin light chain junction region [Macaca mulatta]MOV84994.1 immunoglobulin light chain junction region [Macaca mulatta]MOV85473.1 immunoglobulin light chain junction region [Macaca mulatta]MOV85897.1 immunoglobulin light chain junction region [Macaca mulatta]